MSQRDLIWQFFIEIGKGTSTEICDYLIKHGATFKVESLKDKRKSVSGSLSKLYKEGKIQRKKIPNKNQYIYFV